MEMKKLSKKINQKQILNELTFQLYPNEIVGLVGRNGAGKTTLFRTIAGQYVADQGEILLNGENVFVENRQKEDIFYVDSSDCFFYPYTLEQIGQFYQLNYCRFRVEFFKKLLRQYQLLHKKKFKELSKGQQGLFLMILAISTDAQYLLLDEPFDGLDIMTKRAVIRLLLEEVAESEKSILISSHNLLELENIVDRVLILQNHQITQDYYLDDLKSSMKKYQFVFSNHVIPDFIRKNGKILENQEHVLIALFQKTNENLLWEIQDTKPVFYEELPLTLEDLFITQMFKNERG